MDEGSARRSKPLGEIDVSLIGQAARVDLLGAFNRSRCALDAAEQRLLHAMATDPRIYPDSVQALDKQWVREDVACVLRLSASTAQDRLSLATVLVERLPATLGAVDDARISLAHARRLAEAVEQLSDADAHKVETQVLPKAATQTLAQFVAACARAVIAVDPRSAEEREAAAGRDRRVAVTPLPDGMAQLLAILPAADAWAIKHILDTAASATAPAPDATGAPAADAAGEANIPRRTAGERRADALVDLVLAGQRLMHDGPDVPAADGALDAEPAESAESAEDADDPPDTDDAEDAEDGDDTQHAAERSARRLATATRRRRALRRGPLVQVTVAASTLAGTDEQPAELAGYGAITAGTARRLATDPTARFCPLTVDLSGRLLDVGRASYRPPAHIARYVRTESGTCYFPGCRRRAATCELDHLTSWNDNGDTSVANLHPACPRHHHVKHEAGWRVARLPDRSLRWTSPTGHTYDRPPPDHLPIDRPPPPARSDRDPDPPPF